MTSINNIIAPAKMDYYPWADVKVGDRHITFVPKDDATDAQMNTWLEHEDNYGDKHWTWRRFDKMVVVIKRQCSENICDCEDEDEDECGGCGEVFPKDEMKLFNVGDINEGYWCEDCGNEEDEEEEDEEEDE